MPEFYSGTLIPASTLEPRINFGMVEVNPLSGNQGEEFIQLLNPNSIAVDISGWRLVGGVGHAFVAGGGLFFKTEHCYLAFARRID